MAYTYFYGIFYFFLFYPHHFLYYKLLPDEIWALLIFMSVALDTLPGTAILDGVKMVQSGNDWRSKKRRMRFKEKITQQFYLKNAISEITVTDAKSHLCLWNFIIMKFIMFRNFKGSISTLQLITLVRRSKFLNVNFLPERCRTFIFLAVFQQSLLKITSLYVHFRYELV